MGFLRIKDYVDSCYSNEDGRVIHAILHNELLNNRPITLSFIGIDSVTSSFINTALIDLLEDFSFDHIKRSLSFVDTTKAINELIRQRFMFEVKKRDNLVRV